MIIIYNLSFIFSLFQKKVNNIGILTNIRLENSETFKNMKFPKNKATELYNLFNEMKSYN